MTSPGHVKSMVKKFVRHPWLLLEVGTWMFSSYREYTFKIIFKDNDLKGTKSFEYFQKCLALKSYDETIQMNVEFLSQL
jgi:hypothetical protein